MLTRKYGSVLTLCIAGIFLAIFQRKEMRKWYPSCFCIGKEVQFYCFSRHHWTEKEYPANERKEKADVRNDDFVDLDPAQDQRIEVTDEVKIVSKINS